MAICHQLGKQAEDVARDFLIQQGLRFLQANFRAICGEIDLIMQDQDTIVFVEVRYRESRSYGDAMESITSHKMARCQKTATLFLQQRNFLHTRCSRFDIIAIAALQPKPQIEWVKNAF